MKIILPLAVTLAAAQLAGCHLRDPRPIMMRAEVTTVSDKVCVLLPTEGQEQVYSIEVNEVGNQANRLDKQFPDGSGPLLSGNKCVPLDGYTFEPGKAYAFYAGTKSTEDKSYTLTFTLWKNGKELKAERIQ